MQIHFVPKIPLFHVYTRQTPAHMHKKTYENVHAAEIFDSEAT